MDKSRWKEFAEVCGGASDYIDPANWLDAAERSLVWTWRDLDAAGQVELREAAAEILSRHRRFRIIADEDCRHDDREE